MKKIMHSPFFWISATLISGLFYYFSFHFFPKTFPLVNLSITMDLNQAIAKAQTIASENKLGPVDYQSAALFYTDALTQMFVELEAGGKTAFVSMMETKLYMPYTWRVRHFKEFEKNETLLLFTPDGQPYGFIETISEDTPGAQLTENDAEAIAKEHALSAWNINFNDYKRIEASQKEQPSKRIDHTFMYERINETIGEGFYRLKIYVSGDKVTELTHFIKIPETFIRRHTEMRSANTSIAWAAQLLIGLLYILGGCGLGLYIVFKKRWEMWLQPLKWALLLSLSQTLTNINQLPSLWMYYNSAFSSQNYLIQLLLGFFSSFIFQTAAFMLIIMTAESLTRGAFGNHPQLWSLWIPRNAASYAVFARTLGGYLLVGVMCAFVVVFYSFSTRYLNWWIPSNTLFDPNILASYAPWLSPLARSLNAGFIEECLFRAIPLASAALLGQYYGKRTLFISITLILQALIFGAAHANYATQPAYGRLIELIIPSLIFGITYLRYGLLPSIITHVIYDLIWFSIPIFTATTSNALFSKIIIILGGLLPLLIILYARIRHKTVHFFDDILYNKQWIPKDIIETKTPTIYHNKNTITSKTSTCIILTSIISALIWIWATPFKHDGVTIQETQQQIVGKSHSFLKNKNIELSSSWHTLPLFFHHYSHLPSLAMQHLFIWREGKKDMYDQLLNTYLQPSHWTVRYAQFEGDLIARAEEHSLMFYDTTRHYHKLPESLEGLQLTKEEARKIAYQTCKELFNIDPLDLIEISAQEQQLPNRKNWTFTFSDPKAYSLEKGQARIVIVISGDEVIDTARIIHVPENWIRDELNNNHKLSIISLVITILFLFFFGIAIMLAHREHLSYALSTKLWGLLCFFMFMLFALDLLNSVPSIIGAFNTSEPWNNQIFQRFGAYFFSLLFKAIGFSLAIAYSAKQIKRNNSAISLSSVATGYGIGIIIASLIALGQKLTPSLMEPLWPGYLPLSTCIPLLGSLTNCLISYISRTTFYLLIFIIINQATHYWQKNKVFFSIFFIICGFILPLQSFDFLPWWIMRATITSTIILALYAHVICYNTTLIPLITASVSIMYSIQQGIFNAYPGADIAAIINVIATICVSILWFKKLNK